MVMAYIIFLNPSILMTGFSLPGVDADPRFTIVALAAATALVAGIMTIAMGVIGNYPLALAAGLGINGIVAFSLTGEGPVARRRDGRHRPRGPRRHGPRRWSASARRS